MTRERIDRFVKIMEERLEAEHRQRQKIQHEAEARAKQQQRAANKSQRMPLV